MDYRQEQFLRMQQYQYAPQMPFYMSYPIQNIYMTEMEYERDMERMKELYPEDAKQIQRLVEEECDKMEYEGSMMFDEYPDRLMLKLICDRIYEAASQPQAAVQQASRITDSMEAEPGIETEMESDTQAELKGKLKMEEASVEQQSYRHKHRHMPEPPDRGMHNLIEVLLYNEMYKRRCRHNRCRHWW